MQFNALRDEAQGVQLRQGFARKAVEELPWMKDQENDVSKKYNAMIRDPRLVNSFKSASPEMKAQLPYLLAHAANSLYGRKVLPTNSEPAKQTVPLSPPKAGSTVAKPARPSAKKKAKAYHSQFKNTGDSSDFVKLRTLQLQNR
jgi:hypothetical protein